MFKNSFKNKVILPAIVILVVLTVILTVYMTLMFMSYSNNLINEKVIANTNLLRCHINNGKRYSKAAAVSMANNPEAVNAIKNRDQEEILRVFTSVCELYQVNFFTVTDEKGIVLARTHEPDHFGDSALRQQNVKDAVDGKISTYFEAGTVVKVSVRTGAPVYDNLGTMIGVISAGLRFDTNDAVDTLKKLFRSDVTVFLGNTKISTTIFTHGERAVEEKIDPHIAKVIFEGKTSYSGDANISGMPYKTFYMPLFNAQNEVFAAIAMSIPLSEFRVEAETFIEHVVIIGSIGLVIAIIILYSIISSVSRPLILLANEMDLIESGKLSIVVGTQGDDEIGQAGRALQKVADILHKLLDDIDVAISEHEQGNTDYRLDTSVFSGGYRQLADRIINLLNLGARDALTGLSNRRSFDRRLILEWTRAMREKKPLSLLMIDVDTFKEYNDTYGHQQGDVVLQTVAKTMVHKIRRAFDFVARWGGEEFAILLPSTDSEGALYVAEIIRSGIEDVEIPCISKGTATKVTISIGISTQIPSLEHSIDKLIAQADNALYTAKELGRNRVSQYEDNK